MAKVQATASAPAKPVAATAPAKAEPAKKPEPPAIEYVTSTHLAATIGIKSTILRRWLRTLPQFQDGGYTRYKWEPTDLFLKEAKERYEKFATDEATKQTKRLEEARAKAEKKAKGEDGAPKPTKKGKPAPPPETEVEGEGDEEEVFEEGEGDEGEELE